MNVNSENKLFFITLLIQIYTVLFLCRKKEKTPLFYKFPHPLSEPDTRFEIAVYVNLNKTNLLLSDNEKAHVSMRFSYVPLQIFASNFPSLIRTFCVRRMSSEDAPT